MQDYDKGSKWLIQHHGDAILRLIGVRDITAWKALQAEPDRSLFQKLGGDKTMLKTGSPLLREIFEEALQEGERKGRRQGERETAESFLMTFLVSRFGPETEALQPELAAVSDKRLKELVQPAAT